MSPFNIADQVELPPFSLKNIHDLHAQYTEETNQPFTQSAVKKVYEETAGQPWLLIIFIKRDISKRFLAMRNYILLTYKGKKYIIETKVNRHDDLTAIIEEGILQLSSKYLATESTTRGYLVIYDTKTFVGARCKTRYHQAGEKRVTSFTIAIGKRS